MAFKMSLSPLFDDAGGSRGRSFAPTATAFIPKVIEAKRKVLNSSFITQTIPNVHRYAGVVGICTVPEDHAGMNELGWHIADFLAFRALLCGDNPPRAQSWLAMCDIPALVEANPERYVHGKDRRLVGSAVRSGKNQDHDRCIEREDDIQVETSPESLKEKFILAVKQKLETAMKLKYPLLIIVCGITSLEQDIFFGAVNADSQYTLKDLRHELGDNINHVEATIITPSLFSAGWQTNPSFGGQTSTEVRGDRHEFLARQFGGVFAQDISKDFVGWNCPALDIAKVDPLVRTERFPGPVCPSDEIKRLISQLQVKIQSCLVGGLTLYHMNHSFSFDEENDEWERLIRDRERPLDYRSLGWYERKWAELPTAKISESIDKGYEFLGNAFGGTKQSQVHHIQWLIKESYLAWPDHWASNFGEETKKDFERFMNNEKTDDLDCHEIFNVLEHRARQSSLADAVVQYFDLPVPHNQRCRQWDHFKWKQELSETDRSSLIKYFGRVLGTVPGPNLPPGVNQNNMSKLQRRLESGANYVRAALGLRFLTSKDSSKAAIDHIESFIQQVKVKQAELLASNADINLMCSKWLSAIDMPVCGLGSSVDAIRRLQEARAAEDIIGVLDYEGEYEVYQGDDVQSDRAAGNIGNGFVPSQQFSSVPFDCVIPVQQKGATALECPVDASLQRGLFFAANRPCLVFTKPQEDESVKLSREHVDLGLDVEMYRVITALKITNEEEKREKLATELIQLLQSSNKIGHIDTKQSNCTAQNSASDENAKEPIGTTSSTESKNDWHSGSEVHTVPTSMPHTSIQKPQDPDPTLPPHKWAKRSVEAPRSPVQTQEATERKTPPHLRGLGGGRRS